MPVMQEKWGRLWAAHMVSHYTPTCLQFSLCSVPIARTHREVAPNKIQKYSTVFTNQEHLDMWVASMFEPLEKLLSENCVKGVEDDASFKHHIQSLKEVYLHKKQVHRVTALSTSSLKTVT